MHEMSIFILKTRSVSSFSHPLPPSSPSLFLLVKFRSVSKVLKTYFNLYISFLSPEYELYFINLISLRIILLKQMINKVFEILQGFRRFRHFGLELDARYVCDAVLSLSAMVLVSFRLYFKRNTLQNCPFDIKNILRRKSA